MARICLRIHSSWSSEKAQRVAAREDHVADLRLAGDVLGGGQDLPARDAGLSHEAFAGAEPAIDRADVGGPQQAPVGIAVDQARGGALLLLVQGVGHAGEVHHLLRVRDRLTEDGIAHRLDEREVVGVDAHREVLRDPFQPVHVQVGEPLEQFLGLGHALPHQQ